MKTEITPAVRGALGIIERGMEKFTMSEAT